MMGINITIGNGQGITQAIKAQIQASGGNISNNIDASIWSKVMDEVKTANSQQSDNQKFYSGGADSTKIGNRNSWKKDFVVTKGQVITLNQTVWNKIEELLTGKTPEEKPPVEDKKPPIDEKTPDEKPPVDEKSTPEVKPKEKLVAGKVISRSVDGEKQDIAVIKQNGKKIRREVNPDGTLGDTLASTKTIGKNKYISGDFPPETKIIEREVNGQKSQIGIYKDENGNKVRRLVTTDEKTGKPTLGENLVTVSTAGKNKYVTQSKFDEQVKSMLGLGADEKIPSDLTPEYVTISGQECIVLKKDGQVMDNKTIRDYMDNYQQPVKAEHTPQAPKTGPSKDENPQYDAIARGESGKAQQSVVQAQDPITDPLKGIKDVGPVQYKEDEAPAVDTPDNKTPVSQEKSKPKSYTKEDIENNIKNLKPGESFTYNSKKSYNWGFGSSYEEKNITWKREDDGTLVKIEPTFVPTSSGRETVQDLSTHYSADGKTIVSEDVTGKFKFAKELKSTKHYENEKLSTLTTDLTNIDKKIEKSSYIGNSDPIIRVLSSITKQVQNHEKNPFSVQEFKDTSGNSVVSFKDGKFYNDKGKEISYEKAHKILSKLKEKNELGTLVQSYKPEQA